MLKKYIPIVIVLAGFSAMLAVAMAENRLNCKDQSALSRPITCPIQ